MSDVARVAGVSLMTVSRVLNGTARVSPETEEQVRRAVDKLRYRPNELARALRGMKSRTIGVIVPYLYDPFFATCAHAAAVGERRAVIEAELAEATARHAAAILSPEILMSPEILNR